MKNNKELLGEPPAYDFASVPSAVQVDYHVPNYSQQQYSQYGFPHQAQQVFPAEYTPPQNFVTPAQTYGPPPAHNYAHPHPHPNPQPQPPPAPLPPLSTVQVRPSGCFERSQINRPQMNVFSAASFIFMTGGLHMIPVNDPFFSNMHAKYAWFIGGIIGAAISAFLPQVLPRKAITLFCSMLVLIGGIINASTHNYSALLAALYLNGIANGLVFAPTLALAGEISVFYMRGKICASNEQLSFNLGIFLQILLKVSGEGAHHSPGYNYSQTQGIISAAWGFLAICFAASLFIESPVTMLASGREHSAMDALRRLQRPFILTSENQAQLAEHKLYVAESKDQPTEQCFVQALPAFARLCVLRALNAISISSFILYAMDLASLSHYQYNEQRWCFAYLAACRLLGSLIASCTMDSLGRKKLTLLGLVVCGGLAFSIASQFHHPGYNGVLVMLMVFEIFAGVAFAASSAYLAEAFPLNVKINFISFTFMIELVVSIIFVVSDVINEFFYVIGALYVVSFLLGIWSLPETRRTTLRESLKRFSGF